MSLLIRIQEDTRKALKNRQEPDLSILRLLQADIKNKEIEKGRRQLTEEEIFKLISTQIKKLKESLVLFEKGKRPDLVTQTGAEIKVLNSYLPRQLSDEELEKEVGKIIIENPKVTNPGALIGICIKNLSGRADNQRIAESVKKIRKLQSSPA
ncbi:MAG TPA: GatB/YqeY domain-containing protein [Candidatus Bathyarchaeia archaeon]|nr:GatB/YqeY domain-containing protein [Candidatus Bathyarchaeia archaeon]